jgi:translation initiation factor IF-1
LPNQDAIQIEGTITEVLPLGEVKGENGSPVKVYWFQVELDNASNILAYLPRLRHYIKILVGDRVKVKLDNNDHNKGRITYRMRNK